jgi:hypothetical protein
MSVPASDEEVTLQLIRFAPTARFSHAFANGPHGTGLGIARSPWRFGS